MWFTNRSGRQTRRAIAIAVSFLLLLSFPLIAFANVTLIRLSTDPYTNTTSQHKTEVEPDTFSFGSTIVEASQADTSPHFQLAAAVTKYAEILRHSYWVKGSSLKNVRGLAQCIKQSLPSEADVAEFV
jgi:hypothetical protein